MKLLRSLSPINKNIVDKLKEEKVIIEELSNTAFNKKVKEFRGKKLIDLDNSKSHILKINGYYQPESQHIIVRKDISVSKEYILMHEVIHAIRDIKRANRLFLEPVITARLKKVLKKVEDDIIATNFVKRKMNADLTSWREEAVADCVSIFLCNQYGSTKLKDVDVGNKRVIFVPLYLKNVYTEKEKEAFLKMVRKECLYTLEYIFGNYLSSDNVLWDKKMVISHFDAFFEKEVRRCKKIIDKLERKSSNNV
jgi:hypothetical protein